MIESLEISANQWQFLKNSEKYVEASQEKHVETSQDNARPLVLECTRRQFLTAEDILARLAGSHNQKPRKGILLADDVGLGKTTVAALIAWVFAGTGKRVRILAPNQVMKRRWAEELNLHISLLNQCATNLEVGAGQIKGKFKDKPNSKNVERLKGGQIQIATHSLATNGKKIATDLLIVDEAHRAKGENTRFSKGLKKIQKDAKRVLILTATPFSIQVAELARMLRLIGGGNEEKRSVESFSKAINDVYLGSTARDSTKVAERLTEKANLAVEKLRPFVIRHGIDDLPNEQTAFGQSKDWNIEIPHANPEELETMIRMDRISRISRNAGGQNSKNTNDPRYHVGWQHFDQETANLATQVVEGSVPEQAVFSSHLESIQRLRNFKSPHSKMKAVGTEVKSIVTKGEKVVLFCDHHATAQELTVYLNNVVPNYSRKDAPRLSVWKQAWKEVLTSAFAEDDFSDSLSEPFIGWLCSSLIRAQVWDWLSSPVEGAMELAAALKNRKVRGQAGENFEFVAGSATHLFRALRNSPSSESILKRAYKGIGSLPGNKYRVLGICENPDSQSNPSLILNNKSPDTAISIFNSPFGPDVLVVTDKMSEGIDLHRYCRHLIHYELDPSPIRTIQRNGRLRRVNSWASITKQPIKIAYPAFRGTRDYKLVQIMKKRMDSFSLLLGGVPDFDVDEVKGPQEKWRNEVICNAKNKLGGLGRKLNAKNPRNPDN